MKSSKEFIEKQAGKKAMLRLLSMIGTYQQAHTGQPVKLRFLPPMLRMFFRGMNQFAPHFGDSFYTGQWNRGFDHAAALAK